MLYAGIFDRSDRTSQRPNKTLPRGGLVLHNGFTRKTRKIDEEDVCVLMPVDGASRLWSSKKGSASRRRGFSGGKDLRQAVCCRRGYRWMAGSPRHHSFSPRK